MGERQGSPRVTREERVGGDRSGGAEMSGHGERITHILRCVNREQPRRASGPKDERGVAETLAASGRTPEAASESAASARVRVSGLLDEVARRRQGMARGPGGDRAGRGEALRSEAIEARGAGSRRLGPPPVGPEGSLTLNLSIR